jgi:competence protein ComEC
MREIEPESASRSKQLPMAHSSFPTAGPSLADGIRRAPLIPVALAFTIGVVLDRTVSVPLAGSLFAAVVLLAAWTAAGFDRSRGLPLLYLLLAVAAVGAACHHYSVWQAADDPLRPIRRNVDSGPPSTAVVVVHHLKVREEWQPVSGRVQILVSGSLSELHAGDEIEAVGRLEALRGPDNPGERDLSTELRDDGIRAILRVRSTDGAVTRLAPASITSFIAWRARVRGWGVQVLRNALPQRQGGLAAALLLGMNSELPPPEWDKYIRTGVIHVLVVSGQHLVILAAFLAFCFRFLPIRQRTGLIYIVLFLWAYALVAGGRPSVVRAAVTFTVLAGGLMLRRPVLAVNALAAAWLLVLMLNPGDVNNTGCLLSFICVMALYWDRSRQELRDSQIDPQKQLLDESRPFWQRALRGLLRFVIANYLLSLLLWLVVTPLVASRLHFVPLAGLIIGPPVVWLTSMALIAGFLLLLVSLVCPPLVPLLAALTSGLLSACDWLVDLAVDWWAGQGYVSDLPIWWLIGSYLLLSVSVLMPPSIRFRRLAVLFALSWLCLLLLAPFWRARNDELRVTFLAVGHGGCTVLETPDGRVLVYDAGSTRGPNVTRRQIAPFLWHRGIRRIDELFLSHADLDHFNGVRDLLDRFKVGQITCTPTFEDKQNAAVRHILDTIESRKVPVRIVSRGARLTAGSVTLDVLHPPAERLEGVENVRSMVLLVQHGRHRFLLTGDLEEKGLDNFLDYLKARPTKVDVFMAPHHGSHRVEVGPLLKSVRPSLIVSCQAQRPEPLQPTEYAKSKVRFLGTWPHGAITIRSHSSGLIVETFVTRERFVIR